MHGSDRVDDVRAAAPDMPAGASSFDLQEFGAAATRQTTSANVFGTVDVSRVMDLASRSEDRFGTQMSFAWFDAIEGDDSAHGSVVSMVGKPGDVIGGLRIQTDLISNEPAQNYAVIGGSEPVPAFDVDSVLDPGQAVVLSALRSFDGDLWDVARFELEDSEQVFFGTSPAFLPVVNLMVDGMRLGFMVDAPELCPAEPYMVLMGPSMDGIVVADQQKLLAVFVARQLFDLRSTGAADAEYEIWHAEALRLLRHLGQDDFPDRGAEGFTLRTKRRRPLSAPKGSKWRNDSSGNGVLAAKEAWGKTSLRRPASIAGALRSAGVQAAPAAALYCAQEALALANAENSPRHVSAAYAAMIAPLESLGRPQAAARAAALADLDVED